MQNITKNMQTMCQKICKPVFNMQNTERSILCIFCIKLGDAQLIYEPTRLFRTEVHCHTSRALPAGIEPTTQRVLGWCSTNSTNDPIYFTHNGVGVVPNLHPVVFLQSIGLDFIISSRTAFDFHSTLSLQ